MRLRSCGGRPCVPGWTNPSPRTPSASPPQARSCGTLRPPRSVTSTLRETSIKGAPNRIACETRTQAGFQSSRAQNRHLALCVYVKRSCSNCRCYVNVLAESWKIIHSCAYMRPGAMPSIRHVRERSSQSGDGERLGPYCRVAALNLTTNSAGTRPRSFTSGPCALAHSRTSVVFRPSADALRPPRTGRREPPPARRAVCT
jgi:hypothetical protein